MSDYNKEHLKNALKDMGIKSTDAVMVHSSMKAIGQVEGGADTVVDAFMEYLSEGMFMTPVHTWAQMSAEYNVFNPKSEDGCVGIIPNIFYKRPGVVRSLHPTHSIAAYGRCVVDGICVSGADRISSDRNMLAGIDAERVLTAAEYIAGEENCTTPCAPGGCWERLASINAKILLVGVNHIKNTYIHAVEEVLNVPERLTEKPTHFEIVMPDGSLKGVDMYRHYNRHTAHISESFQKLAGGYEECGVAKRVRFGDADCILCDARGIFEVTKKVLSHEINCFIDRDEIPEQWWK